MARTYVGMAGALALLLTVPAGAQAQSGDWWSWALPLVQEATIVRDGDDRRVDARRDRDDDRWEDRRDRDDDRWDGRRDRDDRSRGKAARGQQKAGNGPPFCRNGQGHPVHGRRWCQEKGWGLGNASVWERARWEDVIFGDDRRSRQRGVLDRRTLGDVLGDVVLGRLAGQAGSGELSGRWITPRDGARVLQVQAGGRPLAELTDLNGDGRVDAILLARGR